MKGTLAARVAMIEAKRRVRGLASLGSSPLTAAERAELARLIGPRPDIANMTGEDADAWLHAHSIDGSDPAVEQRIAELRARETHRALI